MKKLICCILVCIFLLSMVGVVSAETIQAPTNVKWHLRAIGDGTGTHKGYLSWDSIDAAVGMYFIEIYKDGYLWYDVDWADLYDQWGNGRVEVNLGQDDIFTESGIYTAKVRCGGRMDENPFGESDAFDFTMPTQKMEAVTSVTADTQTYTVVHNNVENCGGYVYYLITEKGKEI